MRKFIGFIFVFIFIVNFLGIAWFTLLPILIPLVVFVVIYNVLVKFRPLEQGNPSADSKPYDAQVAADIKKKYNTRDPYDTVATYDPALVEISRFEDQVGTSTMTMILVNPTKKNRPEETMMFLNEGEQVILEPPTSALATVAVYDRSKHLLGYVPKMKNNVVLSLINSERIVKGQIIKLTKNFFMQNIEIEIKYRNQ